MHRFWAGLRILLNKEKAALVLHKNKFSPVHLEKFASFQMGKARDCQEVMGLLPTGCSLGQWEVWAVNRSEHIQTSAIRANSYPSLPSKKSRCHLFNNIYMPTSADRTRDIQLRVISNIHEHGKSSNSSCQPNTPSHAVGWLHKTTTSAVPSPSPHLQLPQELPVPAPRPKAGRCLGAALQTDRRVLPAHSIGGVAR